MSSYILQTDIVLHHLTAELRVSTYSDFEYESARFGVRGFFIYFYAEI